MANRYFPDQKTPVSQLKDRPKWAKGVQLQPEALEALSPSPPREYHPLDQSAPVHSRRDAKWARALAAQYTREAVEALAEALSDKDGKVKVAAAKALFEMAWGKPRQDHQHEGTATVKHITEPGALHAKLIAVVREATPIDESRQLGPVIDAEATLVPDGE